MTMLPICDSVSVTRIAWQWAAFFVPVMMKGGLILGLAFAVTRLMRGASASARHLVWTLSMAGLLLLPLMELALPSWRVLPFPDLRSAAALGPAPSGTETGVHALVTAGTRASASGTGGLVLQPQSRLRPDAAEGARTAANGAARESSPSASRSHGLYGHASSALMKLASTPACVWLFALWLAGVLALCASLMSGLMRLRRLRHEARPLTGGGWPELARSLSAELGIKSSPDLLCSRLASTPMTWGLRRPVVVVPEDCRRWTAEQRREVLLHELAHIVRRDCLTHLLAQVSCLLYWFNPLTWIGKSRMRTERECACDDQVLMAGARPSAYAGHLLEIAARLGAEGRTMSLAVAMARRSRIFDRLDAVLDAGARRPAPGRPAIAAAVALTLAILPPLAALGPSAQADEPGAAAAADSATYIPDVPDLPELPSLPSLPSIGPTFMVQDGGSSEISWISKSDGTTLKLKMTGKIEFNEDETAIEWMAEDAYFRLEKKQRGRSICVEAEPDADGRPIYRYKVGRKTAPFDDEAAAELGEALQQAMIQLGANAGPRVRKAYEQRGVRGVLELVDGLDSDYTKSIYYREFFSIEGVQDDEAAEVLKRMSEDVDSDYELAQALTSYLDGHAVTRATSAAFLDCMSSIDSDYEKGSVLGAALEGGRVEADAMAATLEAAGYIDSDYEKARALSVVDVGFLSDEATSRAYFDAVKSIDSDYEKARVLIRLARHSGMNPKLREACLDAASTIDSTYEYGRVAKALR